MSIKDLKPTIVWNNFYGLTQVPRPSKHEGKVQQWLLDWGKEHGVDVKRDDTGNIIFTSPATPGYENRRGVILQGHMDMVPQKTADSDHDFLKDPIRAYVDGEWVTADRTTLGADNGIGVAMGLAVLQDKNIPHGPIEVLVTYDEETGMTGAECLKPGVLKGDILINLDSEEEGELCVGCAGGLDVTAEFPCRRVPVEGEYLPYKITVKGLQGGHSGMDISLYRANANKAVARILLPLIENEGVKLVSINGGSLRNAIPFEAEAEILVPKAASRKVKALVEETFATIQSEFKESDPTAVLFYDKQKAAPAKCLAQGVTLRVVKALLACPSSVIRMSRAMPGLTETSINMAVVRTLPGSITVHSLMRSAVDSAKAALADRVRCIFELAGAKVTFSGGYSGWKPKLDTPMNNIMMDCWKSLYGEPMKIMATHGGLECALMGAKYPAWEMVSIGPTIKYPHSPDERVNIASVARVWEYLKAVLAAVPEK